MTTSSDDKPSGPSNTITQGQGGRAATGPYIENLNFLGSTRQIPTCDLRTWQAASGTVPFKYYEQSQSFSGARFFERDRLGAVYVRSEHPRLYHGIIDAAASEAKMRDNCVQASFHTEAIDEFKGDLALTLPTLLKCLPETANNKLIVLNMMELAPLHQSLLDSLRDHSHPSAMTRLSDNLAERGIYLLFIIDRTTPAKDIDVGVRLVEVEPLAAVTAEILANHRASDIDPARLDRVIASKLLGSDGWRNAAELHDRFSDGTILSLIAGLEEQIQKGDPRGRWAAQVADKLFPPEGSVFSTEDKRETRHNAAVVESGRITFFIYSLMDSCALAEFDELFRAVVGDNEQVEKIEIEYQYNDRPGDTLPGGATERRVAKPVKVSVLDEFRKRRDGIFRELSIRYNVQGGNYQFQLPFMKDAAKDLINDRLPVTSHEWFNRLVFETPIIFTSSDHVARQLMTAYADWLSLRTREKSQEFSVLSWWSLAAKIAQLGYEKAVEGVDDKKLLVLVGFLSERAAVHLFVARTCMFFQTLMGRPALEYLVAQALNDMIDNRGWKIALGVCRTLQTHSRFDAFHWIVQVIDRGDAEARETAGWLLVRLLESASEDQQRLAELIKRIKSHLPSDGVLKRPSERIMHTIVQRLVFGRAARGVRWDEGQPGATLPFFRSETSAKIEFSASGAEFLDVLRFEVDRDSLKAEATATVEASKAVWFDGTSAPPKRAESFLKLAHAALERAAASGSNREVFGVMLALILVEAFASLRRIPGFERDGCIAAERMLIGRLSESLDSDARHGLAAGTAAAASTLVGLEQLEYQYEIAERLEKWAQR